MALDPTRSTVSTIELMSFTRVWPVMSRTGPQIPVPALMISENARINNAVEPALNDAPNTDRIGSRYNTMIRKKGNVTVNAHRVAAV